MCPWALGSAGRGQATPGSPPCAGPWPTVCSSAPTTWALCGQEWPGQVSALSSWPQLWALPQPCAHQCGRCRRCDRSRDPTSLCQPRQWARPEGTRRRCRAAPVQWSQGGWAGPWSSPSAQGRHGGSAPPPHGPGGHRGCPRGRGCVVLLVGGAAGDAQGSRGGVWVPSAGVLCHAPGQVGGWDSRCAPQGWAQLGSPEAEKWWRSLVLSSGRSALPPPHPWRSHGAGPALPARATDSPANWPQAQGLPGCRAPSPSAYTSPGHRHPPPPAAMRHCERHLQIYCSWDGSPSTALAQPLSSTGAQEMLLGGLAHCSAAFLPVSTSWVKSSTRLLCSCLAMGANCSFACSR